MSVHEAVSVWRGGERARAAPYARRRLGDPATIAVKASPPHFSVWHNLTHGDHDWGSLRSEALLAGFGEAAAKVKPPSERAPSSPHRTHPPATVAKADPIARATARPSLAMFIAMSPNPSPDAAARTGRTPAKHRTFQFRVPYGKFAGNATRARSLAMTIDHGADTRRSCTLAQADRQSRQHREHPSPQSLRHGPTGAPAAEPSAPSA
ncbi:MAG: hypothetical protein OXK81_00355 [Chloroflexota bacterium]|nr:hypothetical protein [Chloroflexota bacterium]